MKIKEKLPEKISTGIDKYLKNVFVKKNEKFQNLILSLILLL